MDTEHTRVFCIMDRQCPLYSWYFGMLASEILTVFQKFGPFQRNLVGPAMWNLRSRCDWRQGGLQTPSHTCQLHTGFLETRDHSFHQISGGCIQYWQPPGDIIAHCVFTTSSFEAVTLFLSPHMKKVKAQKSLKNKTKQTTIVHLFLNSICREVQG